MDNAIHDCKRLKHMALRSILRYIDIARNKIYNFLISRIPIFISRCNFFVWKVISQNEKNNSFDLFSLAHTLIPNKCFVQLGRCFLQSINSSFVHDEALC